VIPAPDEGVGETAYDCLDDVGVRVTAAATLWQGIVTVTVVAALRGTTAPRAAVTRGHSNITEALISKTKEGKREDATCVVAINEETSQHLERHCYQRTEKEGPPLMKNGRR